MSYVSACGSNDKGYLGDKYNPRINVAYRYLGNKTRIADWISNVVSETLPKNATIADPMCGTAAMSEAFALKGMAVIASDALKFPVLHAKARLLHSEYYRFSNVAESYPDTLLLWGTPRGHLGDKNGWIMTDV